MSAQSTGLEAATIEQQCQLLHLPTVAGQCAQLAEQAVRERRTAPRLPRSPAASRTRGPRTAAGGAAHPRGASAADEDLEEFDFAQCPKVSAQQIHELAEGGYIARAEPIIFIGDSGTGKTHLLTGLAVAACRQKRRVRFATAAGLINELVEAKHQLQLGRVLARWARYDLVVLDEVGYVPLAEVGAELLFQVIAERAEKAAVIVTTNLPFSEWTQVVPNSRLCKALLDRITDRAHIIETGTASFRFRRSLEKHKGRTSVIKTITAPPPLAVGEKESLAPVEGGSLSQRKKLDP
jgi:DNA replication protein DnaC